MRPLLEEAVKESIQTMEKISVDTVSWPSIAFSLCGKLCLHIFFLFFVVQSETDFFI